MGMKPGWRRVVVCASSALLACAGGGADSTGWDLPPDEDRTTTLDQRAPESPLEVAPVLVLNDGRQVQAAPPSAPAATSFQPGFHQALRASHSVGGTTTFRLRVPVAREGGRLRVTFRSGDGSMTLVRATVAQAGANGELVSTPVPLTFDGADGFTVAARTRKTSDAVAFPVAFRDELAITFEARGALAASTISAFPGSFARAGNHALVTDTLGGTVFDRAVGVATVDVEGPTGRAFVALGDSITEGYVDTKNDTRDAWPARVEAALGVPVVNAGVSGQGFYDALAQLDGEVLALQGITDCIVLLGTNDLGDKDSLSVIQGRMNTLLSRLAPFCRTWVSTLLPKEKSNYAPYEAVKAQRLEFNTWVRGGATGPDIIDLEAVTRQPGDVHLFLDGLEVDGIHPSVEGHRVMADEVIRVLREEAGL
ncbi:SGNH/GDSL hydrolase family protein [Corallococcus macrosporus]|uniref:GDSL-like lipase/acylhydrolase family protein n=1 Tax=Myxococcus fulvus (strain ATCC BAA-855 / HW-1) TaxID=483219 RepID=F8CRX3_MYXFH|nr:GDSL-type esterase/lipase family protein [Corallococcus macrosporus]AEI68051.1 GDSL-like lipase/acylhydrolase family protein [Corallococcus macrosporus]